MFRHPMYPYMRRQQMRQPNPYSHLRHAREERQMEENSEVQQQENQPVEEQQEMSSPVGETQSEKPQAEKPQEEAAPDPKAEIEDMRLRMAAEMDNFKKRLKREHDEQMRYASEKVLSDLLPALDNLDLAIQYGSTHEACRDMMQGIEMTRKQLLDAVAKSGLFSVGETGEPFNPEIHEAIGMEERPDLEKNTVSRVMQRGYKLNDRLMRPAKVMVNK